MSLPLADPQFWLVTAAAAVALGFALRKALKGARTEGEPMCDKCPRPGGLGPLPTRRNEEEGKTTRT